MNRVIAAATGVYGAAELRASMDDAALAAGATAQRATITGPTGTPRETVWALEGTTAVLELADAVGLKALPGEELAPRDASSRGLGELILAQIKAGVFGMLAGLVACYKGLYVRGGPKEVGSAVNETVVFAFMALFVFATPISGQS